MPQFEYHYLEHWWETYLRQVIRSLAQSHYACFWQSNVGILAPVVIEGCNPNLRVHSNIVCAHEQPIIRVLTMLTRNHGEVDCRVAQPFLFLR